MNNNEEIKKILEVLKNNNEIILRVPKILESGFFDDKINLKEKSFVEYLFIDSFEDNNLHSRIMIDQLFKCGFLDLSTEDSHKRTTVDYMNDLLTSKEDKKYYIKKYLHLFYGNKNVTNPSIFIKKMLDIDNINPHFFVDIWSFLFKPTNMSFIKNNDIQKILKNENFAKKISTITKEKLEKALYGFSPLTHMFSSCFYNKATENIFNNKEDCEEIFKNIYFCSNKTQDYLTHFIYLYNNKEHIEDTSKYLYLFHEIIEHIKKDKVFFYNIKSIDIFEKLIDFFSYGKIIENSFQKQVLSNFLEENELSTPERIKLLILKENSYYQKTKIMETSSFEKSKNPKKRL